eukprot:1674569-Rhodomonas_salina.1
MGGVLKRAGTWAGAHAGGAAAPGPAPIPPLVSLPLTSAVPGTEWRTRAVQSLCVCVCVRLAATAQTISRTHAQSMAEEAVWLSLTAGRSSRAGGGTADGAGEGRERQAAAAHPAPELSPRPGTSTGLPETTGRSLLVYLKPEAGTGIGFLVYPKPEAGKRGPGPDLDGACFRSRSAVSAHAWL